jgi:hypothetical protein
MYSMVTLVENSILSFENHWVGFKCSYHKKSMWDNAYVNLLHLVIPQMYTYSKHHVDRGFQDGS